MPIDAKKNVLTPHASVLRCEQCELGVLSPLPKAEDISSFYDLDIYYTHGQSHIQEKRTGPVERLLTKLAWVTDKSQPFEIGSIAKSLPLDARVCDLGCGHAIYLRALKDLGFVVVGVEPDEAARDNAIKAGVDVVAGTAEDIPDGLGKFDLVLMTHALEHCRNPRQAVENAFNLTKPGGQCYIEVPNCACEHFRTFTICSEMFDAPRHIYFFRSDNLQALAERVGFSVERRLFSGYVRDFAPGWRAWEAEIAARVRKINPSLKPKRHSLAASLALWARSFWRSPERKYDCVGLLLRAPL